eukprot:TRINITY_DN391_c0_g3_i1.p1 TRINITY_DN391_c0_g3~~TRINITY_DN391_c0_g3_i1.p1  ORF type:complete len:158 (-),score=34.99 TRINITY_DN391_c0_g3_i1:656-1129(-)
MGRKWKFKKELDEDLRTLITTNYIENEKIKFVEKYFKIDENFMNYFQKIYLSTTDRFPSKIWTKTLISQDDVEWDMKNNNAEVSNKKINGHFKKVVWLIMLKDLEGETSSSFIYQLKNKNNDKENAKNKQNKIRIPNAPLPTSNFALKKYFPSHVPT